MQGNIARQDGGAPLSQPSEASNATSQASLFALKLALLVDLHVEEARSFPAS
ncbi:hypothetical protein V8C35DRAFT_286481 [Trichoderma chlorosporum]